MPRAPPPCRQWILDKIEGELAKHRRGGKGKGKGKGKGRGKKKFFAGSGGKMPGGGKGGGGKGGGKKKRGESVEAIMQWCAGPRV